MLKEDGHTVLVYHEPSGTIKEVPLGELTPNEVDYLLRGWCQAKLTARLTSGLMKQNPADWRKYNTVMALQPELFKKQMQSLRFTHRSDTDLVFDLQGKVFVEKVPTGKRGSFAYVDSSGVLSVNRSLTQFGG